MATSLDSQRHDLRQIFVKARDSFLDSISEQEKQHLQRVQSPDQLIKVLKAPKQWSKDNKAWISATEKISSFSERLQPYFDVITIVLQSQPEWSMIAWGSIYLMLKLVSNLTSFFTKLSDLLEKIATNLPRYESLMEHAPEFFSEQLRLSLSSFYTDLFEFVTSVTQIFTKKTGNPRRGLFVASRLMCQPFHLRFKNFCSRLDFHCDVFRQELLLAEAKGIASGLRQNEFSQTQLSNLQAQSHDHQRLIEDMMQKMTENQFDLVVKDIRDFLNNVEDLEELDRAENARMEGTAEWIFDAVAFREWITVPSSIVRSTSSGHNILSVTGIPGCGKTVLAASTLHHLQDRAREISSATCYHFFSYLTAQKRSTKLAMQGILIQLLNAHSSDTSVLDAFSFSAKDAQGHGRHKGTEAEIKDLLALVLRNLDGCSIVIDGLDECEDPGSMVKILNTASQSTNTKIIFFSRPNVDSFGDLPDCHRLKIQSSMIDHDVSLYLQQNVEKLLRKGLLHKSEDTQILLDHLLRGVNGMFLWARLMMNYLSSPALTPLRRRTAILSLKTPDTLDRMYYRILDLILLKAKEEQSFARQLFTCMAYGKRLFNEKELECMLHSSVLDYAQPSSGFFMKSEYSDFEHVVIMVSGSLVELSEGKFRFIHKSVQDYFEIDSTRQHESSAVRRLSYKFRPAIFEANCILADTCLSYLLCSTPASPLSGNMLEKAQPWMIRGNFPLLEYATENWISHLELSIPERAHSGFIEQWKPHFNTLRQRLALFLDSPLLLMSWLEALYTFLPEKQHLDIYSKLDYFSVLVIRFAVTHFAGRESSYHREMSTKLQDFSKTLQEYFQVWSHVLSAEPNQIWQDITAYSPTTFFQSTRATTVQSMAARRPTNIKYSTKPLTTISQNSHEEETLVTLTVWTSRSYEMLWIEVLAGKSKIELGDQCRHWMVRYELWKTESSSPELCEEYEFELDHTSIEDQLRKSLAYIKTESSITQKWALPFPIAVAPNLRSFVILSEVFTRTRHEKNPSQWERSFLPIESIEHENSQEPKSQLQHGDDGSSLRLCPYYALQFNDSSDTILYLRKKVLNICAGTGVVSLLAVFASEDTRDGRVFTLRGTRHGEKTATEFKHCSFHPSLPLLIYHQRSLLLDVSKVELWSFTNHLSSQSESAYLAPLSTARATSLPVEYLNFSVSGMEVTVKWVGYTRPEILSICQHPLVRALSHRSDQAGNNGFVNTVHSDQLVTSSGSSSKVLTLPNRRLKSDQLIFSQGSTTTVSYVGNNKKRRSEIAVTTRLMDGTEVQQPITHVPKWPGAEKVAISIEGNSGHVDGDQLDGSIGGEDGSRKKLKVFLHQRPDDFSTMEEPLSEVWPAMITKDARALGRARERSPGSRWFSETTASQKIKFLDSATLSDSNAAHSEELSLPTHSDEIAEPCDDSS